MVNRLRSLVRRGDGVDRDPAERGGLLLRFAVLACIAMVVLGIVLSRFLAGTMQTEGVDGAARLARVAVSTVIRESIGPDRLDDGLTSASIANLDRRLGGQLGEVDVLRVKIWGRDGKVVYSDDRALIGRQFPLADDVREALAGESTATLVRGDDGEAEHEAEAHLGDLIEAYVPLSASDAQGAPAVGVAEIYVAAGPVLARIDQQTHRLYRLLIVGLGGLFALLLPIVWTAARRLRANAARNAYLALHDSLTGLPNRLQLATESTALFEHDDVESGGALMLLDLDGFKEVNDGLGHAAGDDLLIEVSRRLGLSAPKGSVIARLGGDEFAVVWPGSVTPQRAAMAARRLLVAFDSPFDVRGVSVAIDASVGVALAGLHGDDAEELLQHADIAMYAAKRGHRRIVTYSDDLDPMGADVLALVSELRSAIADGQLSLVFQPKVHMDKRQVKSVEALVRWRHPQRGLVMPSVFVPLAERFGLIGPLTVWVVEEAVRQCRAWADAGHYLSVAINVSQANLTDPELGTALRGALERHGVPASAIEIEVTESALTNDMQGAAESLRALHDMGVRLSIDDYGTGYSSIAHLRALPVQCLKIDRSYVAGLLDDPASLSIVRTTVDLAHQLGLQVVAEGVETKMEFDALAGLGCDVVQGYFCARPMPSTQLSAWFAAKTPPPPTPPGPPVVVEPVPASNLPSF